jgi:hypothetical protein
MQKNTQKYRRRKIYTKTLAHPKTLVDVKPWRIQNLWRMLKPGRIQNLWRLPKPWRMEVYWRLQKCWGTGKTRHLPMLAQQEKYADPQKNCLSVRLDRICNC